MKVRSETPRNFLKSQYSLPSLCLYFKKFLKAQKYKHLSPTKIWGMARASEALQTGRYANMEFSV